MSKRKRLIHGGLIGSKSRVCLLQSYEFPIIINKDAGISKANNLIEGGKDAELTVNIEKKIAWWSQEQE